MAERFIQTISNLICANLKGQGRAWPAYVESATYAYNTHPIIGLGYSPYYLTKFCEPDSMTNLTYEPITNIKSSLRDYVTLMENRLKNVSKTVMDIRTIEAEKQAAKQTVCSISPD